MQKAITNILSEINDKIEEWNKKQTERPEYYGGAMLGAATVKLIIQRNISSLANDDDTTNIRLPAKQDRPKTLEPQNPEYEEPQKIGELCQEVIQNIERKEDEKD